MLQRVSFLYRSCKRPPAKAKKSPVGNWLSFFHLGKSQSVSKRRLKRHPSEPNEIKSMVLPGPKRAPAFVTCQCPRLLLLLNAVMLQVGKDTAVRYVPQKVRNRSPPCTPPKVIHQFVGNLMHSIAWKCSRVLLWIAGEPPPACPRRPRSTSEAISAASRGEAHKSRSTEERKAHTLNERRHGVDRVHATACVLEDDLDLCPPAAGISSLDFDPMSFQCAATPGLERSRDAGGWRRSAGCSSESEPISSPNNIISGSESPDLSPDKPISPTLRKKYSKAHFPASPPPLPSSSPPLEKRGAPEGGKAVRAPYQPLSALSTGSQASALTDPAQSGQNLPDPGEYGRSPTRLKQ